MSTIKDFVRRRSVLTYFVLTFAISWGGILLFIGGPSAIPAPSEEAMKLLPIAILIMVAGPTVAGILFTGLAYGRAGLREFGSRLIKFRVPARWYAVAILTAPLPVAVILFAFSRTSSTFIPDIVTVDNKVALLISGIAAGLAAGIFEEIGWTGFVVSQLRQRYSILATGLIVGFVWGIWHFLVTFWGNGDPSGGFALDLLLPPLIFYLGVLPAYRVLLVWVYDHTGSLPVVMLMHASLTANTNFILSPSVTGVPFMVYYLVLSAAMWIVVAAVAVAQRRAASRVRN
jgi:membrane protease YdiL (CAAX protease family)